MAINAMDRVELLGIWQMFAGQTLPDQGMRERYLLDLVLADEATRAAEINRWLDTIRRQKQDEHDAQDLVVQKIKAAAIRSVETIDDIKTRMPDAKATVDITK